MVLLDSSRKLVENFESLSLMKFDKSCLHVVSEAEKTFHVYQVFCLCKTVFYLFIFRERQLYCRLRVNSMCLAQTVCLFYACLAYLLTDATTCIVLLAKLPNHVPLNLKIIFEAESRT